MKNVIDQEITQNFHLADTDDFLSTFLPADNVPEIKRKLEEQHGGSYLRNFGIECKGKSEKSLYFPFVDAANNILQCCPANLRVRSYWISRADDTPKTSDDMSANIRPDAAAVLGDQRLYFKARKLLEQESTLVNLVREFAFTSFWVPHPKPFVDVFLICQ